MKLGGQIVLALVALASAAPVLRAQPVLLAEESGAVLPIEQEKRVALRGLAGTISLRVGQAGELRYEARVLADRKQEQTIAVWLEDKTIRLLPVEGAATPPVLIEIVVPEGLAVELDLSDSLVKVNDLRGDLQVRGSAVELQVVRLTGDADLTLHGGSANINGVMQTVRLSGTDLQAEVKQVAGMVTLTSTGSRIRLDTVQGFEGEIAETDLTVSNAGAMSLEARAGKIELTGLREGGQLRLSGSELKVLNSRGTLDVETDASVQFQGLAGSLKVVSFAYGAGVTGSGSTAGLEIETNGAAVTLSEMGGQILVTGKDLEVRITGSNEATTIKTVSSTINVENARGALTVENEFGDISVEGADQPVQVVSRDGDVRIGKLNAQIDLRADGRVVEVGWAVVNPQQKDSYVENQGGDVTLLLPSSARCRIDVQASGKIESAFPDIQIGEDGTSANGMIGKATTPTIRARAGGDLILRQE